MMQRILLSTLSFLLLVGCASQAASAQDVAFLKRWVQGVPANVVMANLNSPEVRVSPAMARRGTGTSEGFGGMLSRLQPAAAITGTFFCLKSLVPVGDIVVGGNVLSFGSVGTGICLTADNQVSFMSTRAGQATRWAGYESVICGGPRLVRGGVAYVNPRAEGFRDPSLFRPAARTAVGVTRYNKLLLVSVNKPIYLSHMARVMRDLGAIDAINLDGGTSTALYCKGKVPSHPGRRLTNLIVVYDSVAKYDRRKLSFCPEFAAKARTSGLLGERDEASAGRSTTDSESVTGKQSRALSAPGTPELGVAINSSIALADVMVRPCLDRMHAQAPLNDATKNEAAASECGPLPRRISDHTGTNRRSSSS